jgi:hypothetical protein
MASIESVKAKNALRRVSESSRKDAGASSKLP